MISYFENDGLLIFIIFDIPVLLLLFCIILNILLYAVEGFCNEIFLNQ